MTRTEIAKFLGISESNPSLDQIERFVQAGGNLSAAKNGAPYGGFGSGLFNKPLAQAIEGAQIWEADEKKKADEQKEAKENVAPQTDPRYQQLFENQQKIAKDFRNNIPRLAFTFSGQLAENSKKQLANEIDRTQQSYNRRGLLYSTARLGAEGAARETAASDLATKKSDVNKQLNQQADELDQQAIDTGVNMQAMQQKKAGAQTAIDNDLIDIALGKQAGQMQRLNNALGSAGAGAGGLLGQNTSTQKTSITPTNPVNYGGDFNSGFGGLA